MPETLLERIVATAMLISAVLLIVLVVRETTRSDEPRAAATVAGVLNATSPATTQATPAKEEALRPRAAAKAAPAQPVARLLLVASEGDSWLTVRAGSAQGMVLYTGTLARGAEVDVKAKQLWVRFGAAANLTARLNGMPLPLRLGTYNALISPDGLQLVAG